MILQIKKYLWILAFASFNVVEAQHLNHYIENALKNNPHLGATYKIAMASQKNVTKAQFLPNPQFSFGYFVSPIETRVGSQRARFSVTQMFPWFGTLKEKKNAAAMTASANFQQFNYEKAELVMNIKFLYYLIWELQQHTKKQKEILQLLLGYKNVVKVAYRENKIPITDLLQLDLLIEETKTIIINSNDQLVVLTLKFNNLLYDGQKHKPVQVEDSLKIPLQPLVNMLWLDTVYASNAALNKMQLMVKKAEIQEKITKKNTLPQLGLQLNYVVTDQNNNLSTQESGKDAFFPMFTLSLPIFFKKNNAQKEAAKITTESYILQSEDLRNQIENDYYDAYTTIKMTYRYDTLYDKMIKDTKQIIDLQYTYYSNSLQGISDLLASLQQLLKYEIKKISNVKTYYIAVSKLNFLMNDYN